MSYILMTTKTEVERQLQDRIDKGHALITTVESDGNFQVKYDEFVRNLEKWRGFNRMLIPRFFESKDLLTEYNEMSSGGFRIIGANDYEYYQGDKSDLLCEILLFEGFIERLSLYQEPEPAAHAFAAGQTFDAFTAVKDIITRAKQTLMIIDGYIDEDTLKILSAKRREVELTVLTSNRFINPSFLQGCKTFKVQHGSLELRHTNDVHDRFIIVDRSNVYQAGGSLKDLGKKITTLIQMESPQIVSAILDVSQKAWNEGKVVSF